MKTLTALLSASALAVTSTPQKTQVQYEFAPQEIVLERGVREHEEQCLLDVMFLVDTTISMNVFRHTVVSEVIDTTAKISRKAPTTRVALATVGDFVEKQGEQITPGDESRDLPYKRIISFSEQMPLTYNSLAKRLNNNSGGGLPEAYAYALDLAEKEDWRADAQKVVVLFADDRDHDFYALKRVVTSAPYKLVTKTPKSLLRYWGAVSSQSLPIMETNLAAYLLPLAKEDCRPKIADARF